MQNSLPSLLASSSSRPQGTVVLSHLSSLKLKGSWSRCMAFLETVEFPPLSEMTLYCDCNEGLYRRSLLPVLERQSGKTGLTPPLRTIWITRHKSTHRIYVVGWLHCKLHQSHYSSKTDTAPFSLTLGYEPGRQPTFDWDILGALLTPGTAILSLAQDIPHNLVMFRSAIERAQGVKHISLTESILPLFCAAMDTKTETEQTPADSFVEYLPFPSLESIHLHDVQSSPTSTRDLLTRVLEQRSTSRSPIQEVDLDWSVPQRWFDELRTIVPIVCGRE